MKFVYRAYVRPTERPLLSAWCMSYTKISQDDVNGAHPLALVIRDFNNFLSANKLYPGMCAGNTPRSPKMRYPSSYWNIFNF